MRLRATQSSCRRPFDEAEYGRDNDAQHADGANQPLQKDRIAPPEHQSVMSGLKRESKETHDLQAEALDRIMSAHEMIEQGAGMTKRIIMATDAYAIHFS